MVLVRIIERSLATHTHRPVPRRNAHGGGRGTCAVLAHTATRSALSEYARTTVRTPRRRRKGTTPSRSGLGEYSEGTHGRTAIVGAGEWRGHARPAAPRIRYSNGSRSMVRLPHCSQGTGRVLAGYSRARAWTDLRGAVERAVRGTRNGDAQSTSTRGGTANDTEYSTALRHCRGLLPAYSRPRAARVRARQCDGACGRTQGC
jgi:hypothetical protein